VQTKGGHGGPPLQYVLEFLKTEFDVDPVMIG
jgi:hypothetical protein